MSPTSLSDRSAATVGGFAARKLNMKTPRPDMYIHIDNHYHAKVYTSLSSISGYVDLTSQRDVAFDSVQIQLVGVTRTRVDGVNIPQATSHTFLKLNMPIPESDYPVPRVVESGSTVRIPFNFVIPSHLTLNACNHHVGGEPVYEYQTRLPPSLGAWEKDDFAPDMTATQYCIKARILREDPAEKQIQKLIETSKSFHVLPAAMEDPPLNVTEKDKLYTMEKTKNLRKTILSSKTGKITASAIQPPAAMLSPDGRRGGETKAVVDLVFEPTSAESHPPKVTSVSSKVLAITYFSSSGSKSFPNLGDWGRTFGSDGRGSYSAATSVQSTNHSQTTWEQRPNGQSRRDSGYCSEPSASDSEQQPSKPAALNNRKLSLPSRKGSRSNSSQADAPSYNYRSSLSIPIRLPIAKKTFVPTFHSCIASRVYILWLDISVSSGGGISSSFNLAIPLQVGVNPLPPQSDDEGLPSFEAAVEDAEVDEFLRPRVMSTPSIELARPDQQRWSRGLALPDYRDLTDVAPVQNGPSVAAAATAAAH